MGKEIINILKKLEHYKILKSFIKWTFYGTIVGVLCGIASAIFLHLLDFVTNYREKNSMIIMFLPLGGVFTTYLYFKFGKNSSRGNNLILEEIQNKKEKIPFRMGILVLISTLISHLFGASVGREGTAVQMGGSLSEAVGKLFKLNEKDRMILLMSGISGGFGSVFGTPLAGTIFGMEVSSIGKMKYEGLIPCFVASFVGDRVATALNVHHTKYYVDFIPEISGIIILKVLLISILFGLTAILFSETTHFFKRIFVKKIKNPFYRPVIGGIIIIIITFLVKTNIFNGIGTETIKNSFVELMSPFTFLGKIIFTAISLGSGFQGGEVTPLFYIGSTLGNFLGNSMNIPIAFAAALGLIGVFSGASNAPIACFILGIEMFGSEGAIYFFIAVVISYMFSGHHGIYTSQTISTSKSKLLDYHEGKNIGNLK